MIIIDKHIAHLIVLLKSLVEARRYALLVELTVAIITIFILSGLAITHYQSNISKVRKTDLFAELNTAKYHSVIEHAVSGRWPTKKQNDAIDVTTDSTTKSDSKTSRILEVQGNFAIYYEEQKQLITETYRLVKVDPLQPTLYWKCGYSKPRADEVIGIPNITDIPNELLTHNCR